MADYPTTAPSLREDYDADTSTLVEDHNAAHNNASDEINAIGSDLVDSLTAALTTPGSSATSIEDLVGQFKQMFKNITGETNWYDAVDATIASVWAKFHASSGHKHTGGTNDGAPIDMNGNEFILDADADTSITADTDDRIDVKIAGADDFHFLANIFRALSGSVIETNTINETTSGSGITADSVLLKDGGARLTNDTTLKSRNAANDANLDLIKANSSDQTVIGQNSVRATRFVPLNPPVVVYNADPGTGTDSFTDLDVSSQISASAFAVRILMGIADSSSGGTKAYARVNGSSEVKGNSTTVIAVPNTSNTAWNEFTVGVDGDGIFEWAVANVSVSSLVMVVRGYEEYVD